MKINDICKKYGISSITELSVLSGVDIIDIIDIYTKDIDRFDCFVKNESEKNGINSEQFKKAVNNMLENIIYHRKMVALQQVNVINK